MKHLFVLVVALSTICFFANKSAGIDVFVDCSGGIATVIPDIVYVDVGQTVTWRVDVLCENLFCLGTPTFFNIYVPAGPFGEEWRSEQFLISGEIPVTSPTVVNCASNLMYSVGFWDLIEPVCGAMAYIDSSGDDSDCDGISNEYDNCFDVANTDQADADGDCIGDACDTDPGVYDPSQPDTCPPQGNQCGDTCECEGNFDDDEDCDGTDAATFKLDFGRSTFNNPCENGNPCNGDFDCDVDVDGTDAAKFKVDFGRSIFSNPCPICPTDPWCMYEGDPFIKDNSDTGCLGGSSQSSSDQEGICANEDRVTAEVMGNSIIVASSIYGNCCSGIEVELTVDGNDLHLFMMENPPGTCFCTCCFGVETEVAGLAAGEYTIEMCWYDWGSGYSCETETVVVP
jgi:hypothetical protein